MTAKHDQWKYALIERHITKGIVHFVPPYTLFELELDNGCRYVGLAQQGHNDEWSERIGYDVAYGRAMRQAMKGAVDDLNVKERVQREWNKVGKMSYLTLLSTPRGKNVLFEEWQRAMHGEVVVSAAADAVG